MKEELTPKQKQLLDLLTDEIRTKGLPPSISEIAKASNLNLKTQWQNYSGFWKIKDLSVDR
jgi:SOS-response transcriptional repressor LexA